MGERPFDFVADMIGQEHEQRSQEIRSSVGRMEADMRYAILVTGVVWSWLAVNQGSFVREGGIGWVVAFIPALMVGFFWYRWCGWGRNIRMNAAYVRRLERRARLTHIGRGWESWYYAKRRSNRTPPYEWPGWTFTVFWIGLLVLNVGLAFLFLFNPLDVGTR